MKILAITLALLFSSFVPKAYSQKADSNGKNAVTIAVISLNDFHGGFVRNDHKAIPGAPAIVQTVDSLKKRYPNSIVLSAGDNFGGSYFYKATEGVLMPEFFNLLGVKISAVGNHEFDDGQKSLSDKWRSVASRPKGWDITYVCANVRNAAGAVPTFAQPFIADTLTVGSKKVTVAFVGLLASSTPQQASVSKLKGLSFDGNYPRVLDSVKHLPGYEVVERSNVRLLLTHIGTNMADGKPIWDDKDSANLAKINDKSWQGIISSHSHKEVCGYINVAQYPVVQGRWHGEFLSLLKVKFDTLAMRVVDVTPELCPVNPSIKLSSAALHFQSQIDSLLTSTKTKGGTPIGTQLTVAAEDLPHDRDYKYCQTEVGRLVCASYAEAYRNSAGLDDKAIVVGASHFGSIRSGFSKGPVSVLDVGEVLPFSNALKAYELSGKQLLELVNFGHHNKRFGWLQTSGLDIKKDGEGNVVKLTYKSPSGKVIKINGSTRCILVADSFITDGGDGYSKDFFSSLKQLDASRLPFTTDAFINYLRTFKTID